jgi:predicted nucleotidyltransferase
MRIGDEGRLVDAVRDDPDVLGVVLLGSAADTARADEWSDVDLWLVVAEGAQDRYREDLSWLPDHERAVLVARETRHGRVVIFDDGRMVELAVASPRELAEFRAAAARIVLDRGGVAEAVAAIAVGPAGTPAAGQRSMSVASPQTAPSGASRTPAPDRERARRALAMLCARVLVGVGRARRGERISAGRFVRQYAVDELLAALDELCPAADDAARDPLDQTRRAERTHPAQATAIAAACAGDVEPAARRLLDLAEEWFGAEPEWPAAGVAAVRRRLGWTEVPG